MFARFLAILYKLLPKVGPLRALQFKAPTPEAEALFLESVNDTRSRYRAALDSVGAGRIDLVNTDFDTGSRARTASTAGRRDLRRAAHRLAERKFAGVPDTLRRNITAFYAAAPHRTASRKERKRASEIRERCWRSRSHRATPHTEDARRNQSRVD